MVIRRRENKTLRNLLIVDRCDSETRKGENERAKRKRR